MLKAVSSQFSIFTGDVVEGEVSSRSSFTSFTNLLLSSGNLACESDVSVFSFRDLSTNLSVVHFRENTSDLQAFNKEMATLLNSPVFPAIGNQ